MSRTKRNQNGDVAFQTATPTADVKAEGNKVKTTPWGEVRRGTFSITVKSDTEKDEKGNPKVLYEQKAEPFEYDHVSSIANVFVHQGAKLTDTQISMIGKMVADPDDTDNDKLLGEANSYLLEVWNERLKSNAKGKAYAAIFNRVKPVEGEKRESAIASTINKLVKLMGVSPEIAIANLKKIGVVPEEYTLGDYNETKQRRKSEDDEE